MDTKSTKKISFTFIDLMLILVFAVILYFSYYRISANITPVNEDEKIYSLVLCESVFPHGEYVGKIAKYDVLFSEDGKSTVGNVREVKYENLLQGNVKIVLTVEIEGKYSYGDKVFINTDSFCQNFKVNSSSQIAQLQENG